MDYKQKINFFFDQTGLTQQEFGDIIGFTQVVVSRHLRSKKPNLPFLLAISKHFKIDFNYLLNDKKLESSVVNEDEPHYKKPPLTLLKEIENRMNALKNWHNSDTNNK